MSVSNLFAYEKINNSSDKYTSKDILVIVDIM